jgi:fucose 4-O-acetylase-like acetyltransferase
MRSLENTSESTLMSNVAPAAAAAAAPVAKKRMAWVDIAKGIAIIAVVLGHTFATQSLARSVIFMFHMPLFFFMAGFTFRAKPFKEVLVSSAKRLLIPYICIALAWNLPLMFKSADFLTLHGVAKLLLILVFGSGSDNVAMGFSQVGMAWFLACLFCARLILNALMLAAERFSINVALQAVIVAALTALGIFIGQYCGIYLPLSFDVALVAVAFMWVGHQARRIDFFAKFGRKWYVALMAVVLFLLAVKFSSFEMANRAYGLALLSIVGAISGIVLVSQISMLIERFTNLLSRGLQFMGRNSMLIYAFHAVDWLWPWQSFAALEGVPFAHLIAGILRTVQATLLTILAKRV